MRVSSRRTMLRICVVHGQIEIFYEDRAGGKIPSAGRGKTDDGIGRHREPAGLHRAVRPERRIDGVRNQKVRRLQLLPGCRTRRFAKSISAGPAAAAAARRVAGYKCFRQCCSSGRNKSRRPYPCRTRTGRCNRFRNSVRCLSASRTATFFGRVSWSRPLPRRCEGHCHQKYICPQGRRQISRPR